jgi:hypothetical protein
MRKTLAVSVFVLATLSWSLAQNPGGTPPASQQPPSASPQAPDASQGTPPSAGAAQNPSQPGAQPSAQPGSQSGAQPQPQMQMPNAPITEGCLAGSDAGYTLTDKAGTTYKLNFPATANVSVLAAHVGESVKVMGDVTDAGKAGQSSINVSKIGRGTGTCSAGTSAQPQTSNPAQPQAPKP